MKRLVYMVAACGLSLPALAQMTTITATSIKMGGKPIATGTATFTPVDAAGSPIPFVGGGALNSTQALSCSIVAGAITGTCEIPDAALTTPANVGYSVQITDSATHRAIVMPAVPNITGSTWALDAYAPPATTTNVQPIQVSYGTAPPASSCVAPSFYVRNASGGLLYMCVSSSWVLVTGSGGGSGTVTVEAMQAAVTTLTGCADPTKSWSPAANTCVSNSGPQGPAGAAGSQGPKGDAGTQGIQGIKGDTGSAGAPGATGAAGGQGIQGVKGDDGDTGLQGPKGDTGAVGTQGNPGIQGPKGDTGTTGADGAKGDAGAQGPSGGSTNWRGAWGSATTYATFDAVSFSGSSYIATAASTNVTPGTDGTKWQLLAQAGAPGSTGATGNPGATGTTGTTGSAGAAATVAVGTVTTGAAGSSAAIVNGGTTSAAVLNFTIPAGATGSAGSTGAAGAKGDPGDDGAQGPKGDTGNPGATGSAGSTGSTGAAATVAVGTVTPLSPGATPTVSNAGTTSAAVLNFGIPGTAAVIANITVTLPTSAIAANTCTTAATATMTGLATTSTFTMAFASDASAVTGWGSTGGLTFVAWPTANTLHWHVCNVTSDSITPGAMTLNVGGK